MPAKLYVKACQLAGSREIKENGPRSWPLAVRPSPKGSSGLGSGSGWGSRTENYLDMILYILYTIVTLLIPRAYWDTFWATKPKRRHVKSLKGKYKVIRKSHQIK